MDVAVSGSTGLIGSALTEALHEAGHQVVPLVRGGDDGDDGRDGDRGGGREGIRWDPSAGTVDAAGLEGIGAVVNLAGRPIRAGRWTARFRREVLESRTRGTRALATAVAGLQRAPAVMVSASAIGYYGDRGDDTITEETGAGDDFMAGVCQAWEAATAPAEEAGVRVAHVRTGLVLSAAGGLLPRFFPLGRRGPVSGRLGSGRHWMSWVAIDDEVGAIRHLLERDDLSGAFNVTAPDPVTNAGFTRTLARVTGRPRLPPVPAFALKLLFGPLAASETALISQRVLPGRLEASGFSFRYPELSAALEHVLDR